MVIRHCNNYQGISLLSSAYKILSNILPARLTPYVSEIIGDHQHGFCHNGPTTNGMVYQLYIDIKKSYDSVKKEVLYNILLEYVIPKKLVKLIKMCLNETYSKVCAGNIFSIHFLFKMA
jgi:hypothetical protein